MLTLSNLLREHSKLRPPLIHGLVRQGEVFDLISSSKGNKSWTMTDLAISIASGQPWMGRWEVTRGKVLWIDVELHDEVLASRIPKVAAAKGVSLGDISDKIDVENLRGKNSDIFKIGAMIEQIPYGKYACILIDPLYRLIPEGYDENSNAQIARIFSVIDKYAAATGASIGVVHHATKSSQSDKDVVDVGAGAGSMSRAVDCHIILRKHEADNCVVMEAALRSWPPAPATCYKWNECVWEHAPELDPKQLKENPYGRGKYGITKKGHKYEKKEWTYVRKTVDRSAEEIMQLVHDILPADNRRMDSQEICLYAKDWRLSDKVVYRALRGLVSKDRVGYKQGEGAAPSLFWRKKAARTKKAKGEEIPGEGDRNRKTLAEMPIATTDAPVDAETTPEAQNQAA